MQIGIFSVGDVALDPTTGTAPAGPSLKTVLEQLDLLGSEVLPVLRQEFAQLNTENTPAPPTFQNRLQSLSEAHSA